MLSKFISRNNPHDIYQNKQDKNGNYFIKGFQLTEDFIDKYIEGGCLSGYEVSNPCYFLRAAYQKFRDLDGDSGDDDEDEDGPFDSQTNGYDDVLPEMFNCVKQYYIDICIILYEIFGIPPEDDALEAFVFQEVYKEYEEPRFIIMFPRIDYSYTRLIEEIISGTPNIPSSSRRKNSEVPMEGKDTYSTYASSFLDKRIYLPLYNQRLRYKFRLEPKFYEVDTNNLEERCYKLIDQPESIIFFFERENDTKYEYTDEFFVRMFAQWEWSRRKFVCEESDAKLIGTFLDMIEGTEFCSKFNNFMTIGKILYNFFGNGKYKDKFHQLWKEVYLSAVDSDGEPLFEEDGDEIIYHFEDHEPIHENNLPEYMGNFGIDNNFSWKTLARMMKSFRKDEYDKWFKRWTREVIVLQDSKDHNKIARFFYRHYYDTILCTYANTSSAVKSPSVIWYIYDEDYGIWDSSSGPIRISQILCNDFSRIIEVLVARLKGYNVPENLIVFNNRERLGRNQSAMRLALIDIWNEVIRNYFRSVNNAGTFIAPLASCFIVPQMIHKFDRNEYLLNLNNMLIDFTYCDKDNPMYTIRDRMPEDYLTKKVKVNYDTSLTEDSPKVRLARNFFRTLFVNDETREAVLRIVSSFLVGGNKDKRFIVMTGEKDSGKSTFKKIVIDTLLGNDDKGYARDAPVESITHTKGKSAGQASPELAQAKNCKVLTYTEPESDIAFGSSLIKRISGGDSFYARGLFENGSTMKATFKLVLQCNTIPKLKVMDHAAIERFLIIPFKSVFVDPEKAPKDPEDQFDKRRFPKDPNIFEHKLQDYIEGILWLLLKYTRDYFEKGLLISKEIQKMIDNYKNENDPIYNFFKSVLRHQSWNVDARHSKTDVSAKFRGWYKKAFAASVLPKEYTDEGEIFNRLREFVGEDCIVKGDNGEYYLTKYAIEL